MFFFVIRHHRKRKEKEQRGTKKQRTATKNKRKVRLPENDVGHNVENHLNQSESEEEVEEPDDEMGESNAAGAAIAGTATAATATRKGPAPAVEGEGAPPRPPVAKKRRICCSVCRKTGHQKPKCPDLEYADAEIRSRPSTSWRARLSGAGTSNPTPARRLFTNPEAALQNSPTIGGTICPGS